MKFGILKSILSHFKQSLSEPDGTGSYSRMMGAIIASATISWITYIVIVTHALPNMTDAGVFIASGSSAYAVNKAQGIVQAFRGNPNGPQTESPAPVSVVDKGV